MFVRFSVYVGILACLSGPAFGAKIPFTNAQGEVEFMEVPDQFSEGLEDDRIEFISLKEMNERISKRRGAFITLLSHHDEYEQDARAFIFKRMGGFLPQPSTTADWEILTFLSVGKIDNASMFALDSALDLSANHIKNSVPTFFVIMQKSEFDEYRDWRTEFMEGSRRRSTRRTMMHKTNAVVAVIPDFDASPNSDRSAQSMVADTIIKTHNVSRVRMARLVAFEGGKFEEAILAKLVGDIAFSAERRFRPPFAYRDDVPFHLELWSGMKTQVAPETCLACTHFFNIFDQVDSLDLKNKLEIMIGNFKEGKAIPKSDFSDHLIRLARSESPTQMQMNLLDDDSIRVSADMYVTFQRNTQGQMVLTVHVDQMKIDAKYGLGAWGNYLHSIDVEGQPFQWHGAKHKWETESSTLYEAFDSFEGQVIVDETLIKDPTRKLNLTMHLEKLTNTDRGSGKKFTRPFAINIPRTGNDLAQTHAQARADFEGNLKHTLERKAFLIAAEIVGPEKAGDLLREPFKDLMDLKIAAGNLGIKILMENESKLNARITVINDIRQHLGGSWQGNPSHCGKRVFN